MIIHFLGNHNCIASLTPSSRSDHLCRVFVDIVPSCFLRIITEALLIREALGKDGVGAVGGTALASWLYGALAQTVGGIA